MARLNAYQSRYLAEYRAGHGRCAYHRRRGSTSAPWRCKLAARHAGHHRRPGRLGR